MSSERRPASALALAPAPPPPSDPWRVLALSVIERALDDVAGFDPPPWVLPNMVPATPADARSAVAFCFGGDWRDFVCDLANVHPERVEREAAERLARLPCRGELALLYLGRCKIALSE